MQRKMRGLGLVAAMLLCLVLTPWQAMADTRLRLGYSTVKPGEQAEIWGPAKMNSVRRLAESGKAQYQCLLGLRYEQGFDVPKDYAMAALWYKRAAAQGHTTAQQCLGMLYLDGRGVPQDFVRAYAWLHLASMSQEHASSRQAAYKLKGAIGRILKPEQLARARRLSQTLKSNAYRQVP